MSALEDAVSRRRASTMSSRRGNAPVLSTLRTSKRKRTIENETNPRATPAKNTRHRGSSHAAALSHSTEVIDLTGESPTTSPAKKRTNAKNTKTKRSPATSPVERRARMFRGHPPKSFLERLSRATTQRMFVVGRSVVGADDVPEMKFDIVGSTGNIYKTTIGKVPTCDCPDAQKGHQCKHICYVLVKVLKAPAHLQYQLAFLSSELREIYQQSSLSAEQPEPENNNGKRKAVEGDCPICFMEFEPDKEEIFWCRAACGNNIHKACFQRWAATSRNQDVRCVYCRSPWQSESSNLNLEVLRKEGQMNEEGYVNVADQLGLSGERGTKQYL
ncbi:RING finger protein [Aspergillus tanneri]|uniref:Uncharacterized protein n=1 Tax=Aspergillus tanneri TaxID=1220188 RepID=A0A5M9MWB7_9EURO|nr:uncharacterized protein ATNIH1004_005078 [Aspergillus tanneri]KAA8649183.1 hypothetical protein ATNIH1004_005078 [Aspergillus tanneri]